MKENDKRHLRLIDLTGKRYGKLTVIKYNNDGTWLCKCDCGNYINRKSGTLTDGAKSTCGCERLCGNYKHNLCYSRVYKIWERMKGRCLTPTDAAYPDYGGRGIKITDEWLGENGFINFYNWAMNHGYSDELSIDRIDVNGNYAPDNCRWVDMIVQQNNRRSSRYITYNNETHTVAEWARIYDMPYDRLSYRINKGWDVEKALLTKKLTNQFK